MDGRQFDVFSKQLASGVSRREVLRGIIGSAVGLSGVTRALDRAAAQAEPPGPCASCPEGTVCCDGPPSFCGACCNDAGCGSCETCVDGACQPLVCADCKRCSDGTCQPIVCGGCETCNAGVCQPIQCDECETCVDGSCVSTDPCCGIDCGELLCCAGVCAQCCTANDCEGGLSCIGGVCEGGPIDPCAGCPPMTGPECYPDNPHTQCCPPDFGLCCGLCMPWGPEIIFDNCVGDQCICRTVGRPCGHGVDCCDGLTCVNNICMDGSGDPCSLCPAGSGCYPDNPHTPCCPPDFGLCCGLCMPWGPDIIAENCTGSACVCRAEGTTCEYGIACCEGLSCDSGSGRCVGGCTPAWHPCNRNDDCCQGLVCDQKARVCKERASCHGPWETCANDGECCPGYRCKDGYCIAPKGCVERGYACHPKLPCCHGLACDGQVCEVPLAPVASTTGASATTFPNTGAGQEDGPSNLFELAVLGTAVAVAAKVLRDRDLDELDPERA